MIIEHPNSGNNDICFYGGDGGSAQKFRKGTLYFYNNTDRVRPDGQHAAVPHGDQRREHRRAEQHRVCHRGRRHRQVLDNYGRLRSPRTGSRRAGRRLSANHPKGSITNNGNVTGASPGFVSEAGQDYHLTTGSQAIDAGTVLNPLALPAHDVVREYVKHLSSVARALHTRSTSARTSSEESSSRPGGVLRPGSSTPTDVRRPESNRGF